MMTPPKPETSSIAQLTISYDFACPNVATSWAHGDFKRSLLHPLLRCDWHVPAGSSQEVDAGSSPAGRRKEGRRLSGFGGRLRNMFPGDSSASAGYTTRGD